MPSQRARPALAGIVWRHSPSIARLRGIAACPLGLRFRRRAGTILTTCHTGAFRRAPPRHCAVLPPPAPALCRPAASCPGTVPSCRLLPRRRRPQSVPWPSQGAPAACGAARLTSPAVPRAAAPPSMPAAASRRAAPPTRRWCPHLPPRLAAPESSMPARAPPPHRARGYRRCPVARSSGHGRAGPRQVRPARPAAALRLWAEPRRPAALTKGGAGHPGRCGGGAGCSGRGRSPPDPRPPPTAAQAQGLARGAGRAASGASAAPPVLRPRSCPACVPPTGRGPSLRRGCPASAWRREPSRRSGRRPAPPRPSPWPIAPATLRPAAPSAGHPHRPCRRGRTPPPPRRAPRKARCTQPRHAAAAGAALPQGRRSGGRPSRRPRRGRRAHCPGEDGRGATRLACRPARGLTRRGAMRPACRPARRLSRHGARRRAPEPRPQPPAPATAWRQWVRVPPAPASPRALPPASVAAPRAAPSRPPPPASR